MNEDTVYGKMATSQVEEEIQYIEYIANQLDMEVNCSSFLGRLDTPS